MQKDNFFSIRARAKSFGYAFKGVSTFFKEEHNARIHLIATLLVIGLSIVFPVSRLEAIALVLVIGFVWVAELFNTVVERIMDFISTEKDNRIQAIKDISAAAVLLAAFTALLTGCSIFYSKSLVMPDFKEFRPENFSISGTIHEWLILSSCFSCLLLFIRMGVTNSIEYIFLPWNLFLAFIPYWITWWMTKNVSIIENKVKLFIALTAWLLFIPNSFYIITDLFHLTHIASAPKWFDLLLIFSFAWNGILCGIISLRRVEIVTTLLRGKGFSVFLVFMVMWLNAFGIYIGRFLRYNSWDIISDPFSLAAEIVNMIIHPFENGYAWGMTLCYAVFITFLYFTIKKLSDAFAVPR